MDKLDMGLREGAEESLGACGVFCKINKACKVARVAQQVRRERRQRCRLWLAFPQQVQRSAAQRSEPLAAAAAATKARQAFFCLLSENCLRQPRRRQECFSLCSLLCLSLRHRSAGFFAFALPANWEARRWREMFDKCLPLATSPHEIDRRARAAGERGCLSLGDNFLLLASIDCSPRCVRGHQSEPILLVSHLCARTRSPQRLDERKREEGTCNSLPANMVRWRQELKGRSRAHLRSVSHSSRWGE